MKERGGEIVQKNSEILFLYGAKLCNPNGDPDEENRPRLDIKTQTNLVSDLRLKRYFRDYIIQKFGEKYIWVGTVSGGKLPSDERGWSLLKQWEGDKRVAGIEKEETAKWVELIPKLCLDARMFGATVTIRKRGKTKGAAINFTGPVQFAWGYSLHPVEIVESSTITSVFVGREVEEETGIRYGTIGKDWRLYYSLIAFYGIVSGLRTQKTGMRNTDLKLMDNFLWDSLTLGATTRSKIGETPHLYLRVEYKDSNSLIGNLRKYLDANPAKIVRDFKDIELGVDRLTEKLRGSANRIEALNLRVSEEMEKYGLKEKLQKVFKDKLQLLPHLDKELQKEESVKRFLTVEYPP